MQVLSQTRLIAVELPFLLESADAQDDIDCSNQQSAHAEDAEVTLDEA